MSFPAIPYYARRLAGLQNVHDRVHARLLACDAIRIDRRWNVANVRSSFWRLYFNNIDGASVKLDSGSYALGGGRVHFIPAWVHFSCRCVRPVNHLYIHFELMGLPGPVSRQVFDKPFTLPPSPLVEQVAARLAGEAIRPEPNDMGIALLAKSTVYLALGVLLEQAHAGLLKRLNHATDRTTAVWPALNYIELHYDRPLRAETLADLCGLSTDHFVRRFREAVGQTPARYVAQHRTSRAAQELIFGNDRIEDVAEQCGFPNRFYFTRVFKRHLGLTPAAYRRQTRV